MELSNKALELKKEYNRQWREKNREKLRDYYRAWRVDHKEQVKENNRRYWEKKAQQAE